MNTYTESEFNELIKTAKIETNLEAPHRGFWLGNTLIYSLLDDDATVDSESGEDVYLATNAVLDQLNSFRVVDADNNELTISEICSIVRASKIIF